MKEPLAETAMSLTPLFRSIRLAPVASPVTVPPTDPDVGGVVVFPLLPQAARKRVEPASAARVQVRMFKGNLSIGPDGCPARRSFGGAGTGCAQDTLIGVNLG